MMIRLISIRRMSHTAAQGWGRPNGQCNKRLIVSLAVATRAEADGRGTSKRAAAS
jgi:hypothetical protein